MNLPFQGQALFFSSLMTFPFKTYSIMRPTDSLVETRSNPRTDESPFIERIALSVHKKLTRGGQSVQVQSIFSLNLYFLRAEASVSAHYVPLDIQSSRELRERVAVMQQVIS